MKKTTTRIFAITLAVLMLVGAIPAVMSYADETTNPPTKTYDFESDAVDALPEYVVGDANYNPSKTTIKVVEENGNKALYINNLATNKAKPTFTIQFPAQTGTFTMGFRIKYMSNAAKTQNTISLYGEDKQAIAALLEQNGQIKNWDGAWVCLMETYERNVWYNVNIEVNVAANTYNLTMQAEGGEAKSITNFAFRNAASEISSFVISVVNSADAEMYIDDIVLPTDELPPVDPNPEDPNPEDPNPENPNPEDPNPENPNPENPNPENPEDTTELQAAIDKVAADLTAAQTALNTAITNGDTALDGKITALNTALEAAKKAYADADTAMQGVLNTKIESADATLEAAIKAVEKNLSDAITALEAADKTNADAITNAIAALNTAIESAEAAAETADEALQTAIDALAAELQSIKQDLESKIAALENATDTDDEATDPTAIASIIISCVSLCGCIAFAALYLIDKKKKA